MESAAEMQRRVNKLSLEQGVAYDHLVDAGTDGLEQFVGAAGLAVSGHYWAGARHAAVGNDSLTLRGRPGRCFGSDQRVRDDAHPDAANRSDVDLDRQQCVRGGHRRRFRPQVPRTPSFPPNIKLVVYQWEGLQWGRTYCELKLM